MRTLFVSLAFVIASRSSFAEPRWSVGTSAWLLANAMADPPHFYYLEVDYALDARNSIVVEPVTWTYHAPPGIPYGSSYGSAAENYPGFVRSVGLGIGWRRELYHGLAASLRTFHMLQLYHEEDHARTTGYQLFLEARVGWRWTPFHHGFWIEPAVAFNWWPLEAGRPESFRAMDDRWPSYFLCEPWLNAGWSW